MSIVVVSCDHHGPIACAELLLRVIDRRDSETGHMMDKSAYATWTQRTMVLRELYLRLTDPDNDDLMLAPMNDMVLTTNSDHPNDIVILPKGLNVTLRANNDAIKKATKALGDMSASFEEMGKQLKGPISAAAREQSKGLFQIRPSRQIRAHDLTKLIV